MTPDFNFTISSIVYASLFLLGAGSVYIVARFRDHYLTRARQEKCEQIVLLAQRENELKAMEMRTRMEVQFQEREARVRANEQAAEKLRAIAVRLHEEASVYSEKTRQLEAGALAERNALALERERLQHERLRAAGLTLAEARKAVFDAVHEESETEIARLRQEIVGRREEEIREDARRILVDTMQRLAPEISHEVNASIVPIPGEDMKGRLIGREGRNIKAFEQVTGTTLLIDETPDSVLISSYDPVRREIASTALKSLVRDGRIHPMNIEEFVERAREQVLNNVMSFGRAATEKLRLPPFPTGITELLGRLHFRLSLNQNTLEHSIEVAQLAALIATELGIDPVPAKRAGLLHDIGKAIEAEREESHAKAGARLLRQNDEDPRVVNAVAAHHGEEDARSLYAPIIVLADTISATRPGARSGNMDGYLERMQNIERIATSFEGVIEAYAMMAGREVRIIVAPEKLTEMQSREIVRKIRTRIENELQYPGTIHITLIREQRFCEEAR